MRTRLQVSIEEADLHEIQQAARREHLAVAEWVRRALRDILKLQAQASLA